ncbi:hypothetical protein THTE_0196 [Thermogutta terrifontis]|uniref:Uncharacterized protein n=1 Tax=Thermogutta terrifontis TaxID=1331910 RepID=A0A286RA08_9BACT|nr:hypothetical protein THTE_0196 [Thermogutta terrifontis]
MITAGCTEPAGGPQTPLNWCGRRPRGPGQPKNGKATAARKVFALVLVKKNNPRDGVDHLAICFLGRKAPWIMGGKPRVLRLRESQSASAEFPQDAGRCE